ncbi:MAG: 5-formyltetrahydrofolate cyclo-ligase [Pelagibacterales bacterium]|nr:5-formyltetrahydrofolate cyclo-ligase [Pelagibacterales bacterium]
MSCDKSYLRKKFLLKRKKNYLKPDKFDFNLIFKLIKNNFHKKKIIIASYYPSNYEVDTLNFIKEAEKKNYKIALPVIKKSRKMTFRSWAFKEPLYISMFGTLEPNILNAEMIPDLVMVPLVAFDNDFNRIGYGKGYYDRFLKKVDKIKRKKIFLGIAHSFQECPVIPTNKYDFKLDYIFTEQGIISSP